MNAPPSAPTTGATAAAKAAPWSTSMSMSLMASAADPDRGDENRGAAELEVGVGPAGDLHRAAGDLDGVRRLRRCAVARSRGHHHRDGAGSARERLAHTALEHAHAHATVARVADRHDELDV